MEIRAAYSDDEVREIRLLDGRLETIKLFGVTSIKSDKCKHNLNYSWRAPGVIWQESMAEILIGLLSTHALAYAEQCASLCSHLVTLSQKSSICSPDILRLEHLASLIQDGAHPGAQSLSAVACG